MNGDRVNYKRLFRGAWTPFVLVVAVTALIFPPQRAAGEPVDLGLTVTAVDCFQVPAGGGPCPGSGPGQFNPLPIIGRTYKGFFAAQDDILSTPGVGVPRTLTAFRIQIENLVWDAFDPYPDTLSEGFFVGPPPGGPPCGTSTCLGFSKTLDFVVSGGTITGTVGTVIGVSDVAVVECSPPRRLDGSRSPRRIAPGSSRR